MSKPNKKPFIIISVFQRELDEVTNVENTLDAVKLLKEHGITPKSTKGVYKYSDSEVVHELSMVIPYSSRVLAFMLMELYNQECFLMVEADYSGYLVYPDASEERFGQWQSIDRSEALEVDAYTYDSSTDSYYTVK